MVANLFFWRQEGGYFVNNSIQPLLHTWSLAVEEQFYVFLPLLLLLFHRKTLAKPKILRSLLCLAMTVSLTLAVAFLPSKTRAVFFLLPPRSWELLAGCLLATFPETWMISNRWVRELVSWCGLAGIVLPVFLYSKQTLFPGLAALPPCFGAFAIIWANMRDEIALSEPPTSLGRFLSYQPIVFIGLISYSLYLWHWPLLAYTRYELYDFEIHSSYTKLLMLIGTFCLGAVSWRWIEVPFRKKNVSGSRRAIFGLAGAIIALTLILGASIGLLKGIPSRTPRLVPENDLARFGRGFKTAVTIDDLKANRLPRLGSSAADAPVKVLLWGDSHAMHTADALATLCNENGCVVEVVTFPATPPVIDEIFTHQFGLSEKGPAWANAVVEHLRISGIKVVVLAAAWRLYQKLNDSALENSLAATIRMLHSVGCDVYVLQQIPAFDVDVPIAIIRDLYNLKEQAPHDWQRTELDHRQLNSVVYHLAAEKLPATFIDPAPFFLKSAEGRYRPDLGGISLYYDKDHLTARGSHLVLLPALRAAMKDALQSSDANPPTPPIRE
jgi:hypothetical protein